MLPAQERMEEFIHRAPQFVQPVAKARRMARPAKRVSLGALSPAEAAPAARKLGLSPVGVARRLETSDLAQGEWSFSAEGVRVWRVALESPGAAAVRVHFTDFHVRGGKVWLIGQENSVAGPTIVGPYTGDGLFSDGTFWSDLVTGDSVTLAYEPEAGTLDEALPFRAVELAHRFQSAAKLAAADDVSVPRRAAATCNLDVTCYSEYSQPASAVALMIFESEGASYQCSGSLISSATQPVQPFFLTANHCISTPDEARSLITVFQYQTPTCDAEPPSLRNLPRVTGAALLAGQPMEFGDFTLLRLTSFPEIDIKLLGWSSADILSNERVIGISHPLGDFKRIAFGQRTRDANLRFASGERMPAEVGYQVAWLQGVTQGGSSGSPLLATMDNRQYLVGTLSGGPDVDEDDSAQVCRTRNLNGSYGRFSSAFLYLEPYLTSTNVPTGATQPLLSADPNPMYLAPGQTNGRVTLRWQVEGVAMTQIRVGSPTGPAMTGIEGSSGSAITGDWVSAGMVFYLQDARAGDSLGAARTLAAIRIQAIR